MTYQIIRTARGRRSIVDSGSLSKMRNRLQQLRTSTTRGVSGRTGNKYRVTYEIVKEE